ncbi:DNA-directed RNA polymerase subunit beta [Ornithinibacillus sp. 4-3]|uniref:DNA-directed RNA polymerase subunit beta n=1 Tax=Ornithinibacillus sp. 4-3 TaxID=3231488 RepID=A0AB39HQ27_9BACI
MATKQSNGNVGTKSRVELKQQNQKAVKNPNDEPKTNATKNKKQEKSKRKKKLKKPRRRIFPITLRIIIILALCATALVLGAMVGYGIIGDGNPTDVLLKETWQHIIDFVKKEE